jgi:ABC-2 type transport system permease protein
VISLIRAEVIKMRSTPGPWVVLLAGLVLTAIGIVTSFLIPKTFGNGVVFTAPTSVNGLRVLVGAGYGAANVLAPVLGVLCITTEYRQKGITTTLVVTPRRERVLLAKGAATVLCSVLMCITTLVLVAAMGIPLFESQGGSFHALTQQIAPVVPGLFGSFVLLSLFGLGIGILLKNQVGAVLFTIVLTIVLEPLIEALFSALWHIDINFFPAAAGAAVSGGLHRRNQAGGQLLSAWLGALALLVWGLAPGVIGYFTTFRRDVT